MNGVNVVDVDIADDLRVRRWRIASMTRDASPPVSHEAMTSLRFTGRKAPSSLAAAMSSPSNTSHRSHPVRKRQGDPWSETSWHPFRSRAPTAASPEDQKTGICMILLRRGRTAVPNRPTAIVNKVINAALPRYRCQNSGAFTSAWQEDVRHRRLPAARSSLGRKSGVDCNLPPEPAAKIVESARILGAEDNFVFRLKRNNEILAIAPHRHLSPVFHANRPLYSPPHPRARPDAGVIHRHVLLRSPRFLSVFSIGI